MTAATAPIVECGQFCIAARTALEDYYALRTLEWDQYMLIRLPPLGLLCFSWLRISRNGHAAQSAGLQLESGGEKSGHPFAPLTVNCILSVPSEFMTHTWASFP